MAIADGWLQTTKNVERINRDMPKVSNTLWKTQSGHWHWCPACFDMHPLPNSWEFDENLESPTFKPSFKHRFGKKMSKVCHYILTDGILNFCKDCTHELAGQSVRLPELPDQIPGYLKDE